ncbi:MAG: ComF family protein [Acidimicrobiales bacterium]|nr:ComF family protein [Acidimicrobiales bacterium]
MAYDAKHYGNKPGDPDAAAVLAENLGWWYRCMTTNGRHGSALSLIIPVPSLRQRWPHNLPEVLARGISDATGVRSDPTSLVVARKISEMKHIPEEQRPAAVAGAFEVAGPIEGEVLLVDDLLQSGATLSECARTLRAAGADKVFAACATRALKGMGSPSPRPLTTLRT